jgi:adenylate cyclase
MTKERECEVIVSDEVYRRAGLAEQALPKADVTVRGRAETVVVRAVASAASLTALTVAAADSTSTVG